ncbi:MAG TPA: hypothetical protein VGI12_18210 [Vicinamibacterales bacterium]
MFTGIGFALGDGWAGIDLDDCIAADGSVVPEAAGAVARLDECAAYYELSPSGTGLKVIGRASRYGGEVKFSMTPPAFTTWAGARFIAITGAACCHADVATPSTDLTPLIENWFTVQHSPGMRGPVPSWLRIGDTRGTENIERFTDDQVVERVLATPQADKFIRLVRGDVSDYDGDHSRADQALVTILAYWCQGDLDQVDRLFRQTALMRPKWNATSYRRATLAKAVTR